MDELLADYQRHPGLARGETGPRQRLGNLQLLRTTLATQRVAVQRAGAASSNSPGSAAAATAPAPPVT